MTAELIIAPEAEQDIAEAYAWYEVQAPRAIHIGVHWCSFVVGSGSKDKEGKIQPRIHTKDTRIEPCCGSFSMCRMGRDKVNSIKIDNRIRVKNKYLSGGARFIPLGIAGTAGLQ